MTHQQFLANLETALQQLIVNRLHENAEARVQERLRADISEFVRENAAHYSLDELKETFVSAEAAMGLFFEYQEARHLVDLTAGKRNLSTVRPMPPDPNPREP